jgi:excisionase family DNA binding protein
MSKGRRSKSSSKRKEPSDKEWPEVMKLWQAAAYLGVSHAKITSLVHGGIIPFSRSGLDLRVKLVKKSDLDALKGEAEPE